VRLRHYLKIPASLSIGFVELKDHFSGDIHGQAAVPEEYFKGALRTPVFAQIGGIRIACFRSSGPPHGFRSGLKIQNLHFFRIKSRALGCQFAQPYVT
jgi:hypothetical protein